MNIYLAWLGVLPPSALIVIFLIIVITDEDFRKDFLIFVAWLLVLGVGVFSACAIGYLLKYYHLFGVV